MHPTWLSDNPMVTNRILNILLGIFAIVVIPAQIVTTFVLGLAVSLTFGLLLLPISLIWWLLLAPLLGLSWFCNRVPALRNVIGIPLIPWALVADTFVALMPSMGELESRASKLMLCNAWPYTWEFWQFLSRKLDLEANAPTSVALKEVTSRISRRNPLFIRVILRVQQGQGMDSELSLSSVPGVDELFTDQDSPKQKDLERLEEELKHAEYELKQIRRDRELLEDPKTMCTFGGMAYDGDGVPQDYVEAAKWYRISAERGFAMAQHNLALMHENGQGVPKDHAEAAKWFRMAADQGHPGSQNNLGCLYETGEGVGKDLAQAVEWYRKGAVNGNANAVASLKRLEIKIKRDECCRIVEDFADLISDGPPLIGDIASLPHPKKSVLYAIRWMIDHYETQLDDCTHQELREGIERVLPTYYYLFTHLADDWHEIDPNDRDAITRLNQHDSFPEWASALKEKYVNEERASKEASDVAIQVLVDRVKREKAR